MAQPIHYANVKHRTCQTDGGQRRSPVAGPSYESDMELLDKTTGNILHRKHTDGTQVIYNEIFSADPDCKYADKSIPVQSRRTELWNDLYAENKTDKERISAYGEIAIPNNITDEEMVILAQRLGEYFSTTFKRPVDLSVHKKRGNNHIHFSMPEREYKKGKWLQKRKKYYKDMDGNLIYDKVYKDEKGWDIRKPKINKKLVPKGADPYERDPKTGDFLYQKIGERNKKQWEDDTRTGKFLEKEELSQIHNGIDDVVNQFLQERGYNVTVKRNRPEVTKILNDYGIKQIRIPTTDYKLNTSAVQEVQKKNERNRVLQQAIEANFDNTEKAERDIIIAKEEEVKAETVAELLTDKRKTAEQNLSSIEKEYQDAVIDYVENELQPEEIFVNDYMQSHQIAMDFKDKQCDAASQILADGINTINQDIKKLAESETRSDREEARLTLLQKNKLSWESSLDSVTLIRKRNNKNNIRSGYKSQWNGLTGWKRAGYIYHHVGTDAGFLYRDYLIFKGEIQSEKNPDLSVPKNITFEDATANIIKGKSVPGMKSRFDNSLTAEQNLQQEADAVLSRWKQNAESELHTPPSSTDFEFLTVTGTAPVRIQQMAEKAESYSFYRAVPTDYHPEQDYQQYEIRIKEIEEAERAVEEKRKQEAERLSAIAKQNAIQKYEEWLKKEKQLMVAIQNNVSDAKSLYLQTVTGNAVDSRMKSWNEYDSARKSVERLETRYDDIRYEEQEKADKSSFWNRYEPNQYRIDSAYADWQRAKRKFDDTYAFRIPEKPDIEAVWSEEWKIAEKHFGNMSVSDVVKAYKENGIDTKKLESDYQALIRHRKNRPVNPGAPADGIQQNTNQPQKETHGQQDEKTIEKDRKGRKPYTGR